MGLPRLRGIVTRLRRQGAKEPEDSYRGGDSYHSKMVKTSRPTEEKRRRDITEIADTLELILQEVIDANMKLDHIIETDRNDRYAWRPGPYDPFNGYHADKMIVHPAPGSKASEAMPRDSGE